MKTTFRLLLVATVASSALAASAPPAESVLGFGDEDGTNRLALITPARGSGRSDLEQLRSQAALLRAQRGQILQQLESNERGLRNRDVTTVQGLREAEIRRTSLIEREQRVGKLLRSVETRIVSLETGRSPEDAEAFWAVAAEEVAKPRLTASEALARAERTLVESGRRLVDYWSLTPTLVQQDGRTLWRFRFHLKETNRPMDLSVAITVDDASQVGTIERNADSPQ